MKTMSSIRLGESRRRGFTLIELLVVISIIATLAALILPGIQGARASARRLQCLNNIRNVGIAMMNFTSQNGGKFPKLAGQDTYTISSGSNAGTYDYGWPVSLLPLLDNAALYREVVKTYVGTGNQSHPILWNTQIPVFTCPDDQNNFGMDGGLSYVVNAGYARADVWGTDENNYSLLDRHDFNNINWRDGITGSGDEQARRISQATGLFWRDTIIDTVSQAKASSIITLDFISNNDGQTQTLMLAENHDAGSRGWHSPFTGDIAFAIAITTPTGGIPAIASQATPNGVGIGADDATSSLSTALVLNADLTGSNGEFDAGNSKIGATFPTAGPGNAWRPASGHTAGGVNVIFADGHAGTLNPSMSQAVYARLMTPAGTRHGQNILKDQNW